MARFASLLCFGAAAVAAVRDIDIHASASAEFPNVCCFEADEASFEIYDPTTSTAQRGVEKCLMTAFISKDCGSSEDCHSACETMIKANKRYYEIKGQSAQKELEKAKGEQAHKEALEAKALEKAKASADALRERTNKEASAKEAVAKKDADSKSSAFDKAQAVFDKAKSELEQADKASKESKAALAAAAEATKQTEAAATSARDASHKQADASMEEMKNTGAKQLKERQDAIDALASQASSHSTQASKEACQNGDCCCSVNHIPIRVDSKSFMEWDKCLGAKPYVKKSILTWGCNYMAECQVCREILCEHDGKGMCP